MMDRNPFVLSPAIPDDLFCDRDAETRALLKSITNQENVVLILPRRVGKTGLIYSCCLDRHCTLSPLFVQEKAAQIARFVQKCATFLLIMLKCGHTMAAVSLLVLTFAPDFQKVLF